MLLMNRRVNELYQAGMMALADENLIKGKKILDKLMKLAPESPMAIELAGDFARTSGDFDEALVWFERLTVPSASAEWRAIGFMNIASIHQNQRDVDTAVSYYRKALAEFESLEDHEEVWHVKQVIGEVLLEGGLFLDAASALEVLLHEIQTHSKRQKYLEMAIDTRRSLAEAYRFLGRLEDSKTQWLKVAQVSRKYNDGLQLATALDGLGVICQIQGKFEEAKELHSESLEINRNLRYLEGQSVNLGNLARLHIQLEEWEQAEKYVRKSMKIEQKNENLPGIAFDKLVLAEIDIGREKYESAETKLLQLESLMAREGRTDDSLAISSQIGFVHRTPDESPRLGAPDEPCRCGSSDLERTGRNRIGPGEQRPSSRLLARGSRTLQTTRVRKNDRSPEQRPIRPGHRVA